VLEHGYCFQFIQQLLVPNVIETAFNIGVKEKFRGLLNLICYRSFGICC
jgi:hypothetical protein